MCEGGSAMGGYLPLAPGVSSVRYPIRERTFKYVATVQSVTDETCQIRTSERPLMAAVISLLRPLDDEPD